MGSQGDLDVYLAARRKAQRPVSEEFVMRVFAQVCLGLQEVHSAKIIHRDIKLRNILVFDKELVR